MEWETILLMVGGVSISAAIAGQLRYEGLRKERMGVSPFMAIALFMGIACLTVAGILNHNALLTIAGSIGTMMAVFLMRTSFKTNDQSKRKNNS